MELLIVLIGAVVLGIIPAAIAQSKGKSFGAWWLYGAALFIVALPHSLLMQAERKEVKRMQPAEEMEEREYRPPQPIHPPPKWDMKTVGTLLIIVGCLGGTVALFMDTSVSSGAGRVHNIGLMEDRRNFLMIAGLLTIVGVILLVAGKKDSQRTGQDQLPVGQDQMPRTFPVDRGLDSGEYQLYLVKTYAIEKNNTLEKYVINGKLYASLDDALRHAHMLDVAAEELESSAQKKSRAPLQEQTRDAVPVVAEKIPPAATPAPELKASQPMAQVPAGLESWIARRKSGEPLAVLLQDLQHALDGGEMTTEQFSAVRKALLLL